MFECFEDEYYVRDDCGKQLTAHVLAELATPHDLESLADQVEEAYATWQESRRLMNELAEARGFYPASKKLEAFAWTLQKNKAKAIAKGNRTVNQKFGTPISSDARTKRSCQAQWRESKFSRGESSCSRAASSQTLHHTVPCLSMQFGWDAFYQCGSARHDGYDSFG